MAKRVDHATQTVVDDVDYEKFPEIITDQGEVLSARQVAYAYTREGRKEIGKEYPSPIPMEPPLGYVPAKPLYEQIRDMVQRELSTAAAAQGDETFEDADDFNVDDDYDPESPYEALFEPTAPWPPRPDVEAAELAAAGGGGAQPPSDKPLADPAKPLPDAAAS